MFLEWCSIKASWWIFFPTCNWKEPDILPWSQKMSVVNKKFVKKMSTSRILRRFPFTPKWLRKKILDCVKNVIWQVFFTILDNQITIFSNQIYFPFPSKAKKNSIFGVKYHKMLFDTFPINMTLFVNIYRFHHQRHEERHYSKDYYSCKRLFSGFTFFSPHFTPCF